MNKFPTFGGYFVNKWPKVLWEALLEALYLNIGEIWAKIVPGSFESPENKLSIEKNRLG